MLISGTVIIDPIRQFRGDGIIVQLDAEFDCIRITTLLSPSGVPLDWESEFEASQLELDRALQDRGFPRLEIPEEFWSLRDRLKKPMLVEY